MELRHLRYFVAVAEEQNVTRAAARLHVSQPPLTRQIQDLEEELGVGLFERSGKAIRLTDAGRVFLKEARASLQRVEEAIRAVRAVATGHQGELHLGYAPTPTVEILPLLLAELRKRSPALRVVLHDHASPEMTHGLREGRLQAALMMQPTRQAGRGLAFEVLRTYPVGVAVPPRHSWARRPTVTAREVLGEPLVAYSRKEYPDYHQFLARSLGRSRAKLNVAEECDSGSSLAAAVESGRGLCVCPSVFLVGAGRRLAFVPLHPAPPPAVVVLARRAGPPSLAIARLLEVVSALRRRVRVGKASAARIRA